MPNNGTRGAGAIHGPRAGRLVDLQAPPPAHRRGWRAARCGQSLVESCIVIAVVCLLFLGIFQLSQIVAAKEILSHAAARGARAETVGFNRWMVAKVIRVAAIPNAGRMIVPEFENEDLALREQVATLRPGDLFLYALGAVPASLQAEIERARIPEYLDTDNAVRTGHVLDYSRWDSVHYHVSAYSGNPPGPIMVDVRVTQAYSNWVPLHAAFYAADVVHLAATNTIESHYPLYIDPYAWEI